MAGTPTETKLLENFLLPPAPLPALLSLKTFTALFPSSQRSSPAIRALYRNLQAQRMQTIDTIKQNIANEAKRGLQQRRAIARARREEEKDNIMGDEEIELEESIFGPSCNLPTSKPHTLKSIIPELDLAVEGLNLEIRLLEEEDKKILNELNNLIGGLSDLRYGKMENSNLRNQVLERCLRLERACESE